MPSVVIDSSSSSSLPPDWIALVREKVEGLRYGVVQLVVHDGRVTQIERTEKTRLPSVRETPAAE
ncbi:MAG TPA: YezD family protein [Opitutaceae bacterium]|nr:YezD family protein [Opitutaceae bacterium]